MILLKNILDKIDCTEFIGDSSQQISTIVPLSTDCKDNSFLFWCSKKNESQLVGVKMGTVICPADVNKEILNKSCNYILVDNPRKVFSDVLASFFVPPPLEYGIEKSAFVSSKASVSSKSYIGHNVVIEDNVTVGDHTLIMHNTVIKRETQIGNHVKIGSNNTIGEVGFGYEKDDVGNYIMIPHIGNVIIEDHVEIGNNTCIDRAVLGSTILRKNVKVDNLVHIAHGVVVGENSLIIANAMVAGSVKIGKNVWLAPSSSILNQKKLGDNVVIGMGAVVLKDVADNDVIIGNPGKPLQKK